MKRIKIVKRVEKFNWKATGGARKLVSIVLHPCLPANSES